MDKELTEDEVKDRINKRRRDLGLVLNNGVWKKGKVKNNDLKYLVGMNGIIVYR